MLEGVITVHETTGWLFRHEPGRWLSAQPSNRTPAVAALFFLFVFSCLTFFLVAALQLALTLQVAWTIGGTIGLSAWLTLVVFRKRNVVQFDPPLLVEHRRF